MTMPENKSPYHQHLTRLLPFTDFESLESLFQSPSANELFVLEELGLPPAILDFYRHANPTHFIRSPQLRIQLAPLKFIYTYNLRHMPGLHIVRHGLLVLATCINGDAFCVRCHQFKGTPDFGVYILPVSGDFEKKENVEEMLIKVTESFDQFLTRFVDEALPGDYEEAYDHL